jgi:polyisoprenoid-binding protein YceI
MKKLFVLGFAALLASCGGKLEGDRVEAQDAQEVGSVAGQEIALTADQGEINWQGSKLVGKTHYGYIKVSGGVLMVDNNQVVGGKIVADMASVYAVDMEGNDYKQKLEDHLRSADFFEVENYPTAVFELTSIEPMASGDWNSRVTGNLTIKDVTKSISFLANVEVNGTTVSAKSEQFVINRAGWNVKYGSPTWNLDMLKDNIINDEIALQINVSTEGVTASK